MLMCIMKILMLIVQKWRPMSFSFFFKVEWQGQQNNLITRNIYDKYESSRTHWSKVISKITVFKNRSRSQGKNVVARGKVLSKKLMRNTKALAFTDQKLLARLKF